MKKFLKYFILWYFLASAGTSYSEVAGKNNYELAQDEDFKEAVNSIIANYYIEGNLRLSEAIKNIIEEYCYVENTKIVCD